MNLLIDGALRSLTPLREFRARFHLPPSFGVAYFEPKDGAGLGRIDGAGAELNALRANLLRSLTPPDPPTFDGWLAAARVWQDRFRDELTRINPAIGLREVEIDFAVAGFGGVVEAVIWAVARARQLKQPPPTFDDIYADWLNSTVRVGQAPFLYAYEHQSGVEPWQVHILRTAYGRAGLVVIAPDTTHYVHDSSLGCAAEGFMQSLLADVTTPIQTSR